MIAVDHSSEVAVWEPEPPCTCIRVDADLYDARWCERCNEMSEWNVRQRLEAETLPRVPLVDTEEEVVTCPF